MFYVGATIQPLKSRLNGHLTESKKYNHSVLKYIRENKINPIIELVEECDYSNKNEFIRNEKYWIDQFRQWGFPLRNVIGNKSAKRSMKRMPKRSIDERLAEFGMIRVWS